MICTELGHSERGGGWGHATGSQSGCTVGNLHREAILDRAAMSSRRLHEIHVEMSRRTEDRREDSMGARSKREVPTGEERVSLPHTWWSMFLDGLEGVTQNEMPGTGVLGFVFTKE